MKIATLLRRRNQRGSRMETVKNQLMVLIEQDILFLRDTFSRSLRNTDENNRVIFGFHRIRKEIMNQGDLRKRVDLLNDILFSEFERSEIYSISWLNYTTILSRDTDLYVLILCSFFKKTLKGGYDIGSLMEMHIEKWNNAFRDRLMPVTFKILIDDYDLDESYELVENFSLKRSYWVCLIYLLNDEDYFEEFRIGTHLNFKTSLAFTYQGTSARKIGILAHSNLYRKNMELREKEVKSFLISMYLSGFDFSHKEKIIFLPWWLRPDIEHYLKLEDDTTPSNIISSQAIMNFKSYRENFIDDSLFLNEDFGIIFDNFYDIFNRENIKDTILDSCKIFDFIFTKGPNIELKYRVSVNGAFFISQDWSEFANNFNFLKKIYDIRSTIIHGDDWEGKFDTENTKLSIANSSDLIVKLKEIVNLCVKNFIVLAQSDSLLIKTLTQDLLFFLRSSGMSGKHIFKEPIWARLD